MPAEINFKKKYLELRTKYINDIDMSFRLGMEQGLQQAQQQQALEAQSQVQEHKAQMEQMQASGGTPQQPGQPSEQPGQPTVQPGSGETAGAQSPGMESPQSSELDQHIDKLQGMIGGNSPAENSPEAAIQKSIEAIVSLRKEEKLFIEMKKAEQAIAGISRALHKPELKLGIQASHNLQESGKQAVSMQVKIVNDVMESWEKEEAKAGKDIKAILGLEHVLED